MGTYTAAALTGLTVLLVCTVIIFVLIIRHMRDLRKWERIAEDNYLLGKDEASQLLRETCDKIAEDRELLAGRSERALLTQILLTLDSQSRRMDSMDDKLRCISHYKTYTSGVTGAIRQLEQGGILLEKNLAAADASVEQLQLSVQSAADRLETLVRELSGIDRLHREISGYCGQLSGIELVLRELQEKADSIVTNMDSVMTTHDQSPARRLKTLEMEITGLSLLVNSIQDSVRELTDAARQLGSGTEDNGIRSQLEELTRAVNRLRRELVSRDSADATQDGETF